MKLTEPRIPRVLDTMDESAKTLTRSREQEELIQGKLLKNISAEGEDFSTLCFSQVRFEACSFINCSFEKAEFTDTIFQTCNFSNCNFRDSYFSRCQLLRSKGVGVKFCGSSIQNTWISECNLDYANFDSCKLEQLSVEHTELNYGNITQCRCKNITWQSVRLVRASFFHTPLKGMDFTSSDITGLTLSEDYMELKGAVVDLYQAAELAKRLGVVVKM